jgi:hypothetical protein
MHYLYRLCLGVTLSVLLALEVGAQSGASGPWVATVLILKDGSVENGSGVYLGSGLVLTAAHLTQPGQTTGVRIASHDVPATIVKQGVFENVDLSVLSVDQTKLPKSPPLPTVQLCQAPPWPGDRVVVIGAKGAAQRQIASPRELPLSLRRFSTLIVDATPGGSGFGVFNPDQKCLLGIVSRAIGFELNGVKKDFKYFVPASDIREFMAEIAPSK